MSFFPLGWQRNKFKTIFPVLLGILKVMEETNVFFIFKINFSKSAKDIAICCCYLILELRFTVPPPPHFLSIPKQQGKCRMTFLKILVLFSRIQHDSLELTAFSLAGPLEPRLTTGNRFIFFSFIDRLQRNFTCCQSINPEMFTSFPGMMNFQKVLEKNSWT